MREVWFTLVVTGALVWLAIALAVLFAIVFWLVPTVWREVCYLGYATFADKARRQAIRERERAALQPKEPGDA